MAKDYYQVLGIKKTDDQTLIKKAYREKAKTQHPDKSNHPNAQIIFQELNEAYLVLSNPLEKAKYDEGGTPPEMTFEEVLQELRKRDAYYWDRKNVFRHQGDNVYPPTDYVAAKKGVLIANLIAATIALLFLVDLSFTGKEKTYEIKSVYPLFAGTQNTRDLHIYKVFVENREVILYSSQLPTTRGDEASIRFSSIFQKPKILQTSSGQIYEIRGRGYVLWISILVLFVSLFGTTPIISPERQFNAAVIASFFSLILLISLLFA